MGDALLDLEQVLRSKKVELTLQESNIMLEWRAKAMRDFTLGCGGGAIVNWLATRRFSNVSRLGLTMVAAATCGVWNVTRSIDSIAERVLSLEGSRMQQELATIMLNKYGQDPRILQRFSKFFFREEVIVDTSIDKPIFRWRLGNSYGDPNHSQDTSYDEETHSKKNYVKKSTVEHNQVNMSNSAPVNAANVMVADPFHLLFEIPLSLENIPDSNAPSTSHQRPSYRGRHRRRHRRHHQEDTDV